MFKKGLKSIMFNKAIQTEIKYSGLWKVSYPEWMNMVFKEIECAQSKSRTGIWEWEQIKTLLPRPHSNDMEKG